MAWRISKSGGVYKVKKKSKSRKKTYKTKTAAKRHSRKRRK